MVDVYAMRLHEVIRIDGYTEILRVPGGWIYKFHIPVNDEYQLSTVFIPFDNMFMGDNDENHNSR